MTISNSQPGPEPAFARQSYHTMSTPNRSSEINVGVDVGKFQLDIHIRPADIHFSVSNDTQGIREALKTLGKHRPDRIVVEATGRLEQAFVCACAKAGLPFVIANPVHIKKFAGAIGQLAKTDKLDARLIARYGEMIQPELSKLKPEIIKDISDLLSRRNQLVKMQTMEKNRLQIMPKSVQGSLQAILKTLQKEIAKLDKQLLTLIDSCEEYREKSDILKSVPGVGNVTVITLLSCFPELGYITNKQAAALAGVAPMNRESGRYHGVRKIRGGRHQVRTVIFMGMMSAIQCNPVFKAKYEALVKAGKSKKVALIACVRKLIVTLNSMVRDGTKWRSEMA